MGSVFFGDAVDVLTAAGEALTSAADVPADPVDALVPGVGSCIEAATVFEFARAIEGATGPAAEGTEAASVTTSIDAAG